MTFSEKLVKLRKIKGITQDEFASAVGVSRQAVYKWECGQSYPEAAKLIEIKAVFGISIDDLLDDSYEVIVPEKTKKRITPAKARAIESAVEEEEAPIKEEAVKNEETVIQKEEEKALPEDKELAAVAVTAAEKAEPAPAKAEEPVPAPVDEKKDEKRGFFARLFGR